MRQLVPCPGCARHVRASEAVCPFCGDASPRVAKTVRAVERSRTLIFGAALASTAVAGCLSHTRSDPENDAGTDAPVVTPDARPGDAGTDAYENVFPPYGTPPVDAFEDDAGTSNSDYGGPPPPEDAGEDVGGPGLLYGGAP